MCRFPVGCMPEKTRVSWLEIRSKSYRKQFRSAGGKTGVRGDGWRVWMARSVRSVRAAGERIRATARSEKPGWCRRGRSKCWRPRRSGWPPAARFSAAAADATISTPYEYQLQAKRAILVRSCGGSGRSNRRRDRVVTGPAWDIATRAVACRGAEDRLSRAALAQPVRD